MSPYPLRPFFSVSGRQQTPFSPSLLHFLFPIQGFSARLPSRAEQLFVYQGFPWWLRW